MSYPKISFVNDSGQLLPIDEDGIPFVVQFKARWYVKLDRPWVGGVALKGLSYLPLNLMHKNNLWAPPKTLSGDVVRRSGEITAVLINKENAAIHDGPNALLRIKPANISEQQMDTMISDIGIMALTTACCVNRAVPIPLGEQAGVRNLGCQWTAGSGLLATATALLDLGNVTKSVWSELEKRPLRSFITQPGLVNVERAPFSSNTLLQRIISPSKRRIRGIERTESTICHENEFLCYVLDKYLQNLADALVSSLDSLVVNELSDRFIPSKGKRDRRGEKDREFYEFIERSRENIRMGKDQSRMLRQQISDVLESLEECQRWAKRARQSNFLKDVVTPQSPSLNSLRLTESLTYGLIYSKFIQVKGDALESIQEVSHLIESIFQGQVKPTWEVYEIWCLAKLYGGLVMHSALKPVVGEAGLFQSLSIAEDGSIEVPKEKKFKLIASIEQSTPLEVSLTYEPRLFNTEGRPRTPDFIVEIKVGEDKKSYCFDAKYRCYAQQGAKAFKEDAIGTAKEKYREGLKLAASFILHSDAEVDYWGEVPFSRFYEESFSAFNEESDWVSHEYGAISLVPGKHEDIQIEKIIRLLLQYHSAELSTTCVTCGYRLVVGQDVCASWKPSGMTESELVSRVIKSHDKAGSGTGVYCSCPKCGDFWVIQSCFGPNHRLLKFQNCFHEPSAHPEFKGKWMYTCPSCGSDPSLEELAQKRKNHVIEAFPF